MTARAISFDEAPFLVIWETTRSCALSCKHCRADAILRRDPAELNTEEGCDLLNQIAGMGTPIVVFSGGDALNRDDLEYLIAHAKQAGLRTGAIPAATPLLTRERLVSLKRAGLDQVAFSLDGPTAHLHDEFRRVDGSFSKTLEAVHWARQCGLAVQINTCFASWNFPYLEDMVRLVRTLGISFWEVFFLIPMGRGDGMRGLTTDQFEEVFDRMRRLNYEQRFIVKLTEAPHYRRFVMQREEQERVSYILARPRGVRGAIGMSPQAVNAGKGFAFIDHVGNICPSGFLPIVCGNIRDQTLAEVYRNATLFKQLRDRSLLKGKCGTCEFSDVCGGSRARAYAVTGDPFASDPYCGYKPRVGSSVASPNAGKGARR